MSRDTVVENNTTKTNGVGAPMFATGGNGNDTLIGADKVADNLRGQNDQDVIRGGNSTIGAARDELNGGSGIDQLIGGDGARTWVAVPTTTRSTAATALTGSTGAAATT